MEVSGINNKRNKYLNKAVASYVVYWECDARHELFSQPSPANDTIHTPADAGGSNVQSNASLCR